MKTIIINIAKQTLTLFNHEQVIKTYTMSSALNGVGELENTGCTPRGMHIIAEKFGTDHAINSVFVARQATGEIYTDCLAQQHPDRDWILSRIMWLEGCEPYKNKGHTHAGNVCDSKGRYIYIHGTPDTEPMGIPMSHGCIRMRNKDVIELYDLVSIGTEVSIIENAP